MSKIVSATGLIKREPWWPLLFLAIGGLFIIDPLVLGGHVPGNSGDSRFNLYVLEHFYQSLCGVGKSFLDAPFFYPWPATIGFSDTHWGTGFIYAVLRSAGLDTTWAFSWWFLIGNLLNFLSCYYVFRKFGLRPMGAGFGAFLYCFCLPVTSQFSHVQLVYRAGVPLAVLFLQRYLESRNPVQGSLMVLFFCLQAAATFYLGIFLLLLLGGWVLGWLLLEHQTSQHTWTGSLKRLLPSPSGWLGRIAALCILMCGAVILAFSIWPNLEASKLYGFKRGWDEIKIGLPQPSSFLQASHSMIWWQDHNKFPSSPLWWEKNLFPGLVMTVAVLASLRRRSWASNPMIYLSRASLLFMVVATISVFGHSFYYFLEKMPGFDAIRAICRIVLAMVFPASFITGAFVEGLATQPKLRWMGKIAAAGLIVFTLYEASKIAHQRDERVIWSTRVDTLEKELHSVHPGPLDAKSILVFTYPENSHSEWWEFQNEIDAMLLSQKIGISTMNGYSGNLPYGLKRMCTTDDLLDNIASAQKFRVSHGMPVGRITAQDLMILGKGTIDSRIMAEKMDFPTLLPGKKFTLSDDPKEVKRYFLNKGWGEIEVGRVMSQGNRASLIVRTPTSGNRKISLDLESMESSPEEKSEIQIAANGLVMSTEIFTRGNNRKNLKFQLPEAMPEYLILTIKTLPVNVWSSWISSVERRKRRFALHGISLSIDSSGESQ